MNDIALIEKALEDIISPYKESLVGQAMAYSLKAGGKRIRPLLTLEFCRMLGGDKQKALQLACAVEMIHTYSLIHDDLPCMDNDDLRRGMPSCHKKFDEATALLAGDGLLTLAFNTISNTDLPPKDAIKAVKVLSEKAGVFGMIGGQELDIKNENNVFITADDLVKIYKGKTSALLESACMLGVIASSNYTEKNLKNAEEYGYCLGVAFQIVDDVLDVIGDEKTLGKPIGSDDDKNKTTFVSIYGYEKAVEIAKNYSDKAIMALENFSDNDFLKDFTNKLIYRKN